MDLEHYHSAHPSPLDYRAGSAGHAEALRRANASPSRASSSGDGLGWYVVFVVLISWAPLMLLRENWDLLNATVPVGAVGAGILLFGSAALLARWFPRTIGFLLLSWAGYFLIVAAGTWIADFNEMPITPYEVTRAWWMLAGGVTLAAVSFAVLVRTRIGGGWERKSRR